MKNFRILFGFGRCLNLSHVIVQHKILGDSVKEMYGILQMICDCVKLSTVVSFERSANENDRVGIERKNFPVARALQEMGADIHWTCEASMFNGNALNVAHTPQQADQLLECGVEIERNLSLLISKPFKNPAIMAARHNDTTRLTM